MRKIFIGFLYLILAVLIGLVALPYLPYRSIGTHEGISPEKAELLREHFTGPHHAFQTSDGITLFLRRWDPDTLLESKTTIAVLILHGITAHSGAYNMVGEALSGGGYTTFGVDYRGHGLSGGNRADCPDRERWIADLNETVHFIKGLGFQDVIIFGHSLGVAAAIYTTMAIPEEVSGLILLSGGYRGRPGVSRQPTLIETARILSSAILRPSVQVVEYYRKGMTGEDDPLFNFKYTLRFLRMLNIEELILPPDLNIPVLVGVGDKDELFEIDVVKELYEDVPGNKKEFIVLKDAYHARFPDESWDKIVDWLDRSF